MFGYTSRVAFEKICKVGIYGYRGSRSDCLDAVVYVCVCDML